VALANRKEETVAIYVEEQTYLKRKSKFKGKGVTPSTIKKQLFSSCSEIPKSEKLRKMAHS
jgi:hypothetical protein